jgi:hypothetical protein
MFVMTKNGTPIFFPKIQFLNIPLEIKQFSCQSFFGTQIANGSVGISK